MNDELASTLRDVLPEDVVGQPGDPVYAAGTSPHNTVFRQAPAVVVRARSAADVAAAVRAAATTGHRVAVQSSGHGSWRELDARDLLIDTGRLDAVAVDPATRTARVGAGATWTHVAAQAHPHGLWGLAGTSGTVGVTGYLVGGGIGWLARSHGLASATLRAVEYVDATGRRRHTDDPDADPDALWAFRGGAPLGVATELELELVPVEDMWAGHLLWPVQQLDALAGAWLEATASAPSALTSSLALLRVPTAGPFPDELLGSVAVHLSYASTDGAAGLDDMRRAMIRTAAPLTDSTGPADPGRLAAVHLDPPVAVPGRGDGHWLRRPTEAQLVAVLRAADTDVPGGLNMIEVRHVGRSSTAAVPGAFTAAPSEFLLHAVGGAPDDAGRATTDAHLQRVLDTAGPVLAGHIAPSFRDGRPTAGRALEPAAAQRLRSALSRTDPEHVFAFRRPD